MNNEDLKPNSATNHELFDAHALKDLDPGKVVFGRFVLNRLLGRGGMGNVWLANDQQLEQDIAIKVLPDGVVHDPVAVNEMKRETKRSLNLNHHNIIRIHDFHQDKNLAGIAMEFIDGPTLSQAKAERLNGCFDVDDISSWVEQICEALTYAHETAKIVHRNLKPSNIMVSKSNTIKVADFKIAYSISESATLINLRAASTICYISLQQALGQRPTPSDDIYSLGVTIYELLTGKPPFYAGNILQQIEHIVPPSMSERRRELDRQGKPIPEAWETTVAACLEKDPSKRPTSALDLARRLKLGASDSAVSGRENVPASAQKKSGSKKTYDVFISHSSLDKAVAVSVCTWLEKRGISCWIAHRDIRPGATWAASILEALKSVKIVVLIFSSHCNDSPPIRLEVERAMHLNITIILMRIENVPPQNDLEFFLSASHWLDAYVSPFDHHLEALEIAIKDIL